MSSTINHERDMYMKNYMYCVAPEGYVERRDKEKIRNYLD